MLPSQPLISSLLVIPRTVCSICYFKSFADILPIKELITSLLVIPRTVCSVCYFKSFADILPIKELISSLFIIPHFVTVVSRISKLVGRKGSAEKLSFGVTTLCA